MTKWSARINDPSRVEALFRRAFTLLRSGRPGPVLLELPIDVAVAERPEPEYRPPQPMRSEADPEAVGEAVRLLREARYPLLHVGQGVLWAGAGPELQEFAELAQLPVMTTLPGKSAFPESHPLSVGNGGYSGSEVAGRFLERADLLLGLGCSFTTTTFGAPIPPGRRIIHQTNQVDDVNKDVETEVALVGDARLVLRQLIAEWRTQGGGGADSPESEIAAARQEWWGRWQPLLTSAETPINPYRIIHELMAQVDPAQAIVTHDSGTPRDQISAFYQTASPRGFLGWGKSTQLGSSLGFALGAKLAAPEKLVVQFLGDTALGMCGMDLETAARERIPILTLLLNNGLMGGYERYIPIATERYRSRYLSGDYGRVAEGLGVQVERVSEPVEIAPTLRRAIAATGFGGAAGEGRPVLIEFVTREETRLSRPW